jgi:hypothetical protein
MNIQLIREPVSRDVVSDIAKEFYGNMVKGVVDIERGIIALGGEWHRDANDVLIKNGSKQDNVWGFNFYLDRPEGSEVEHVSLINIRPAQGNRKIEIQDKKLKEKMTEVIYKLIK